MVAFNITHQTNTIGHISIYFTRVKPERINRARQARALTWLIASNIRFEFKRHRHIQTFATAGHKVLHRLIESPGFTQCFGIFELNITLLRKLLVNLRRQAVFNRIANHRKL